VSQGRGQEGGVMGGGWGRERGVRGDGECLLPHPVGPWRVLRRTQGCPSTGLYMDARSAGTDCTGARGSPAPATGSARGGRRGHNMHN